MTKICNKWLSEGDKSCIEHFKRHAEVHRCNFGCGTEKLINKSNTKQKF